MRTGAAQAHAAQRQRQVAGQQSSSSPLKSESSNVDIPRPAAIVPCHARQAAVIEVDESSEKP
ncbi:hypothetical protein PAXRUDRAFT_8703 [Paxillus rubicundulus Ve08.2h10]|uniref:Uncharacterized protein n=1 Tax=Paxillus rubicundulus Ve08.2h10 TaxID=930991 RepID=A0A0D0E9S4_9AGAM|nr:hypothetical protein PAXRUDRAFT_8703 [Paxillus rubicundulus Ve08.2h10]